jgi:hypothetical protein
MRATAAILAGFITTLVLALGTDFLLKTVFPNQSESSLTLRVATLLYTEVFAAAGGFVTARIAHTRPMRAVLILALVAFGLSLAILASGGNDLPTWYKIASLVLLIPCTLAGAWLTTRGRVSL